MAIVLLGFWLFLLLSNFVWKGNFFFEGNAIVQEMNFTYAGDKAEQQFLNTLSGIKKLDLEGSQPEAIDLTGKFSSPDPTLNQKLTKLDRLTLQLPYAQSRLILAPALSISNQPTSNQPTSNQPSSTQSTSQLTLLNLRLLRSSQVNQLTYQPQRHQLSFCLQTATARPSDCLFSTDNTPSPQPVSTLQL
jgi:hypothetical protein